MDFLDNRKLEKTISKSSKHVVVQFAGRWSSPSRAVTSILEKLELTKSQHALFVMIDIYEHSSASEKYGIVGIPTVCIFKNGKEVARYAGVFSQKEYEKQFSEIIIERT